MYDDGIPAGFLLEGRMEKPRWNFKDLTGQKFGRLTVLKRTKNNKNHLVSWLCKCDCGNFKIQTSSSLNAGYAQSCGCLHVENTIARSHKHGHSTREHTSPTYRAWIMMFQRCNNPANKAYKYYGGRGVKICKKWNDFRIFLADMGKKPKGLTLERKDNNGNYEPNNCKWATMREQIRNSRQTKLNPLKVQVIKKLLKESSLTVKEIAEIFNVTTSTIYLIKIGKSWGDIIYQP